MKKTGKPDDVVPGKMTIARWQRFLALIAAGVKRAEAEKDIGLSSYTVQAYLISNPKAKDEYAEAQLEWVRHEMDPTVIDGVIERVADGMSVKAACEQMLVPTTKFHTWILRDPLVQERYDEARKIQSEGFLDEMIQIADDGQNDTFVDAKGNTRTDFDVVQRSKLRLDQRRWHASKSNPRRYGDRVAVEQKTDITTTVNHVDSLDAARRRKEAAAKVRIAAKKEVS